MSGFSEKRLESVLKRHSAKVRIAVETGSFEGKTANLLKRHFPIVHSIELEPSRLKRCRETFPDIEFHLGNSVEWVERLSAWFKKTPVLWYLDAHWFDKAFGADGEWGLPVAGGGFFPLWNELDILKTRTPADIVIVDDVHAFSRHDSQWAGVSINRIKDKLKPRKFECDLVGDQLVFWFLTS